MIILMDAEKAFDRIHHAFMVHGSVQFHWADSKDVNYLTGVFSVLTNAASLPKT